MKNRLLVIFTALSFLQIHCNNKPKMVPEWVTMNPGRVLQGTAVKIIDGDTFDLLLTDKTTRRIRLYGIDCPERQQPYYQTAKDFLGKKLQSATIRVAIQDQDVYGRTVGIVWADNYNVNEALLQAGLTWHYKRYDRNPRWEQLEREARHQQTGLWADAHPIAPWTFKHSR